MLITDRDESSSGARRDESRTLLSNVGRWFGSHLTRTSWPNTTSDNKLHSLAGAYVQKRRICIIEQPAYMRSRKE